MSDNLSIHRQWVTDPEGFQAAINQTAQRTGFRPVLIEKDYYCSVILSHLAAVLPPFSITVMSVQELWAEKIRAAVSRREPAIRDFFDLDYAVHRAGLKLEDRDLLDLVERKLAVKGNNPVDMSLERRTVLKGQVEKELKVVLRAEDFGYFNLNRIWTALSQLQIVNRNNGEKEGDDEKNNEGGGVKV
jgi:predicted nucleotidyltransferase component of viral defense system